MKLREVCVGLAVLLGACSMMAPRSSNGLEKIESDQEVVRTVDPAGSPAPATRPAPPAAGETRTLGADPRLGGGLGGRMDGEVRRADASGTPPTRSSTPAWMPDNAGVMAPMAGRVGIMSLLGNELRHVHAGTTPFGNHAKDYNVQFDFNGFVVEELRKSLLTRTPYQPVIVASTGALRQAASTWQDSGDGKTFAPALQREFDGIIKQNRLAMLIVISYPVIGDGQLITGQKLSGSGLYTRSFMGSTKAAVFSTLQFYRLVGTPAQLVRPIAPTDERSIGDLPGIRLPDDLEDLPARYLAPVYEPLRIIVRNKIAGLISLPRKLGQ